MDSNKISVLNKESIPFYVERTDKQKYSTNPMRSISESEILLPITLSGKEIFELSIENYENGIFQIILDLPDKTIKYKNKVNIGSNLIPKKFNTIIEEKDKIILINTDNNLETEINKYKIIIELEEFSLRYLINDVLLLTINNNNLLNMINGLEKGLKTNIFDMTYYNINKCFGLPERPQPLFINDGIIRLYNIDDNAQIVGGVKPTYGSIPMLHGVNKDYIFTVFNNNSSDQYIEIKTEKNNKNILWIMEGGIINLYLSSDTNYYRNFKKIADITGYAPMPPQWVFGYHQCRWGYKDCNDVMEVQKKFNELNIPIDCFWLDIEHTDDKRYFTWDPKNFFNAKDFLEKIYKEHRYFVTIIDPHIKVDDNYFVCKTLKDNDCYIKNKNEKGELENYKGHCWPGKSYYADFLNPEKILPFYKSFYKTENYFMNYNNLGTWVDMNEPSVFNAQENDNSMPKTNIHNDGTQLVEHREVHNIYGYFYQKVAYEALKSRLGPNKRAFTLSRSFYAGTQQNGFIWTGDQGTNFDFLNSSIETNIINGLCGISGCGSDVGGFMGNPIPEIMKAWYSLGIFYSFFRGHSCIDSIRREPWLFEKSICDSIIESIRLRYHLLMYTYTKFYEHVNNGIPILKPIWMKFKNNFDDFISMKEQGSLFVFGDELIGCNHYTIDEKYINILKNKLKVPIYDLINGNMLDDTFKKDERKLIQSFVIGGNIIPWTYEVEKCSYYVRSKPLSVKIYVDEQKSAIGHYYFDDGISIDNNGEYIYIYYEFKNNVLKIINKNKHYKDQYLNEILPVYDKIEIFGREKIKYAKLNGKEKEILYNEEKKSNILDLLSENIKLNNIFEIYFIE